MYNLCFIMDIQFRRFYLLKKQNLIKKSQSHDILGLVKRYIGLHSTDYLTPYFSLWNRVENFEPSDLFNAIINTRDVLRLTSFRNTLFIVHKDDITSIIESTRSHSAKRIEEGKKIFQSKVDFDEFEEKLLTTLKNNQMTNKELFEKIGEGIPNDIFRFLVQMSAMKGLIARTNQKYITDKTIRYGLMHEWIPDVKSQHITEEDAIKAIFMRYVELFGPVCLDDFCWWLPTTKTIAKTILEEFEEKLEFINIDDVQYFLTKDDYKQFSAFDSTEYTEPVINFLPYEDHFPKGYKIREWFISNHMKDKLFGLKKIDRGEIRPSIWFNGEIVGRWEYEWIDKKKTAMKIVIPYLNDKEISGKNHELIEQKRVELELFTNEKLVPLIKLR